jgi:GT2 family glycosyltransferase
VVAVVVTYRRPGLLTEALTAVFAQTRPPEAVVVVDNASGDGTAGLVAGRFPAAELLVMRHNTGGAGGFAAGIARALDLDARLVWLMDDDTVPEPGALAALVTAWTSAAPEHPAVLASRVLWTDGRDHPMNTPRRLGAGVVAGCGRIRSASFVSVMLDADAVRERGLPIADYFLWNDDFEYTARLLRGRHGLLCPGSVVVHKTKGFGGIDHDPGSRFFYEVRNKVWLFARSRALSPPEKILYGASTLRRWARTFRRSTDRRALSRELRRGLWAGVRSGPRPTSEIIGSAAPGLLTSGDL